MPYEEDVQAVLAVIEQMATRAPEVYCADNIYTHCHYTTHSIHGPFKKGMPDVIFTSGILNRA